MSGDAPTTTEQEIGELTDRWQRAIEGKDQAAAAQILAREYALVILQAPPVVVPRAEWLRMLPDYDVRGYTVAERIVQASDVVVTVFQRVDQTAVVLGAERSGIFVLVDVWVREDGDWRVWRRHSAPLSAGPAPRA